MTKDMTKGNTFKHLVEFAIPLILGNLFQLTYNAVDAMMVGQFGMAGVAIASIIGWGMMTLWQIPC